METVPTLQTDPESFGHNELGRKILSAKAPRRPIDSDMDAEDISSVSQTQTPQPSSASENGVGQSPNESKNGPEAEETDGSIKTSSSAVSLRTMVSLDFNNIFQTNKCYAKDDQLMDLDQSIFNNKRSITQDIDAFNWLDDWDVTIIRCQECRRPFPNTETLKQHTIDHHSIYNLTEEVRKLSLPYFRGIPDDQMVWADQTEVIFENGDLLLRVQEHRMRRTADLPMHTYMLQQVKYFQVSSAILAAASQVFKGMLGTNSGFRERLRVARAGITGNPPAVISLIDDDPQVLRIILLVLHWKMEVLPQTIEFTEGVKMAVLADKYQLQKPLKLIFDKWSSSFSSKEDVRDVNDIHQDWLLLAWVFEYPKQFMSVSQQLVKKCFVRNGELWVKQSNSAKPIFVRLHPNIPQCVTDKLLKKRLILVERMQSYIAQEKTRRTGPSNTLLCKGSIPNHICDALQNNHFLTTLKTHFLESPDFWSKSLTNIHQNLNRLTPLKMTRALGATNPENCALCSFPTPQLLADALTRNLPSCCTRCRDKEIHRRKHQRDHSCIKSHEASCSWLPGLLWAAKCALRADEHLQLTDFRQLRQKEGYADLPPVRTERNSLGHKRRVPCGTEVDAE